MPEDYSESFREAVAVFHYAQIYDAEFEILKHMKPIPEKLRQSLDDLDFLGPDIPATIATAIAKGNLDPTTMEAFNQVPTSRIHLNSNSKFRTSDLPLRQEATAMSTQECCFSLISSHKARKERTTVTVQTTTMMEEEESKYLDEATALEKLVSPSNTKSAEENKTISEETPLKVPDNNPFRKRKLAELQVEAENVTEPEPVSSVTEVGDSEMCATPESQESVDSKPIKAMMDGKERAKQVKLEGSDRRNLNCKKGSILNFFSRV